MKHRLLAVIASLIGSAVLWATPASAAGPPVPVPNVVGPIPVTEDSYPFLATDIDLSKYGYVEEEYFIDGDAYTYDLAPVNDPSIAATRVESGGPNLDGTYPFKTRIVVRRPLNPSDSNGTVVAEWYNVTAFRDIEWNWFGDPEFMLKNGYTFVGISAQKTGADGLKAFDAARYGDINVDNNGGFPSGDPLSYDIYGAALNAIRGNRASGPDPLGGIATDTVIASGESQSCGRLSAHYNKIEPLQDVVDAYLLTVCGSQLRTDRPEKAVRILTETENRTQRTTTAFPDTDSIRHWEVAGGSHLPRLAWDRVAAILNRDFLEIQVTCTKFPLSLVQWPFTANRAIKGLVDWVESGKPPPEAPRGEYDSEGELVRDPYGIALGGIRYPELTVPTATNDGINSLVPGGPIFSQFCGLLGSSTLFDRPTLDSLYSDHADYVSQYADAVDDFLATDFILPEDADRLKEASRQFPELRPTAPMTTAKKTKGKVGLNWVGTEAADTEFLIQRRASSGGWKTARGKVVKPDVVLKNEPQGTHKYRVRSSTVIPENNIAEQYTTTTPYSEQLRNVKVDRTGPKKPKIKVKGKRIGKNTYRGAVRIKVVGKPDPKLPDGSAGVGLKKKSVPKVKKIRKKGRTVYKVRTRDKLGNKSKTAKVVIKIK